jgi:hypothetical protein
LACRGVLFALSPEDEARVLGCTSDVELLKLVQEGIEQRWEDEHLAETDKAWDAMHRCLTNGELSWDATPLGLCILGGGPLYRDTQTYVVSYKTNTQVREVAQASAQVGKDWLRERYFSLTSDYDFPLSEEDFEYTWEYFEAFGTSTRKQLTMDVR